MQRNDDSIKTWAIKGQKKRHNSPIMLVNSPWAAWATPWLLVCSDINYKAQLAMVNDIDSFFPSREIIDRDWCVHSLSLRDHQGPIGREGFYPFVLLYGAQQENPLQVGHVCTMVDVFVFCLGKVIERNHPLIRSYHKGNILGPNSCDGGDNLGVWEGKMKLAWIGLSIYFSWLHRES